MKISKLVPSEYNPRSINSETLERLKSSISEHSKAVNSDGKRIRLATTITINGQGNRIIGGHQRVQALVALGVTDIADRDITWVNLTPGSAEEKALNLSLNNQHNSGEWDFEKLEDVLSDIKGINAELFNNLDFGLLCGDDIDIQGETDGDAVPEDEEKINSKVGKIYKLGNHKLMCGDCTKKENIEKLLNGNKIDMVFTDPPYGINIDFGEEYSKSSGNGLANRNKYKKNKNDNNSDVANKFIDICFDLFLDIKTIFWGGNYYNLPPSKCWLVFYKKDDLPPDTFCDTELAWTNCNKHTHTIPVKWRGMIKEGESGSRVHPNQKPILLIEKSFDYLDAGNIIFDAFLGSGSTIIAAEKTNRICYGMELDEYYCDIIRKRWAEFVHGVGCDWIKLAPIIK